MKLWLTVVAALVLASAAAAAPVKTKTAHLGAVRATVTWQPVRFNIAAKRVHLVISRRGRTLVDRKLGPAVPWAIKVRDLDGNGEAEVIADFYTGGAHCCLFSRIYRYTGTGYVALRHLWGDPSYSLRDLDARRKARARQRRRPLRLRLHLVRRVGPPGPGLELPRRAHDRCHAQLPGARPQERGDALEGVRAGAHG